MLSDYPIYFDDRKLFTPESWDVEMVRDVIESEMGDSEND